MTLTGGKRKVNKGLKAWVTFVKKVQKEEKLSYKDAIHRAKQRKDKGEKWMKGGNTPDNENMNQDEENVGRDGNEEYMENEDEEVGGEEDDSSSSSQMGGRRRRRTMRRSRASRRSRTRASRKSITRASRRSRARSSRRH